VGEVSQGGRCRWGCELGLHGEEADEEVAAAQQGRALAEDNSGGYGGRGESTFKGGREIMIGRWRDNVFPLLLIGRWRDDW